MSHQAYSGDAAGVHTFPTLYLKAHSFQVLVQLKPRAGKSLMRNATPVIRLLSSGCHPVLTKVNGKIPIDFQVWGTAEQILLYQEGVCNYLAAQTA